MFNQSVPAQQQAFQGGNVAAQQQILAGLPQIQNALFGNQVDLSGLQPYQAPQQDLSFLNQQLPFTQAQMQTPEQRVENPTVFDTLQAGQGATASTNVFTPNNNETTNNFDAVIDAIIKSGGA